MEDNKNCILLKRKEYDELVKKAESKKPDTIRIEYFWYNASYSANISSTIDLSKGLKSQILSIDEKIIERIEKQIQDREQKIRDNILLELKGKGLFGLYRWLKNQNK